MSYLYILESNLLLFALFANIFSQCRLSFHFIGGFLCCAKAFGLVRPHLKIFAFVSFALEKEISLQGRKYLKNITMNYIRECSSYVFFW